MKKSGGCLSAWACASILGIVSTCFADERPKPPSPKPSLTVTVTTPQTGSLAQKITANGSLAAWQEATVGAQANGLQITEVRVNVGDRVQRGDVLAVLQADTLRAELAQAEASLAERSQAQRLVNEHEMGELFKVVGLATSDTWTAQGFERGDRSHRL